jgi:hypothetical protein
MSYSRTAIHVFSRRSAVSNPGMRTAVSLHSHSECSRESLDFIPHFARQVPVVSRYFELGLAEHVRKHGRPLDFTKCYWRPPATPDDVIASEREHLQRRLGLTALVSLTDHDTIEGPVSLRASGKNHVPLSLEWTVPFEHTTFHLGVHAIRPAQVHEITAALRAYTTSSPSPSEPRLTEILEWLCECDETLIVLNHPYWDIGHVGQLRHDSTLLAFLRAHRDRIHGLELNGYRAWGENRRVLPLAQGFGIPIVGGGDRHGLSPNTIVNLTRAGCFGGFVRELRTERVTQCVVFPEYRAPFVARLLECANDILAPDHRQGQGARTWADRVFTTMSGYEQSAASLWRVPSWVNTVVGVTRLLGTKPMSAVFEVIRSDGHKTLDADCGAVTVFGAAARLSPDSAAA